MLLERMFSENKEFEISCIICGGREFVSKGSELGKWLVKMEHQYKVSQGL